MASRNEVVGGISSSWYAVIVRRRWSLGLPELPCQLYGHSHTSPPGPLAVAVRPTSPASPVTSFPYTQTDTDFRDVNILVPSSKPTPRTPPSRRTAYARYTRQRTPTVPSSIPCRTPTCAWGAHVPRRACGNGRVGESPSPSCASTRRTIPKSESFGYTCILGAQLVIEFVMMRPGRADSRTRTRARTRTERMPERGRRLVGRGL